jgi:hypothetical protein
MSLALEDQLVVEVEPVAMEQRELLQLQLARPKEVVVDELVGRQKAH